MTPLIYTELTFDELRAVMKSLSIGCDQLSKKLDRLSSTKYHTDVQEELMILMSANNKFGHSMSRALSEMPDA